MAKPGLLKLLAVIFYDAILLLAVLFAATYLILPLNHGEAFSNRPIAYPLYLLSVCFAFYGWFWTHGGQTLGMRTWKLKLLSDRELQAVTWKQALIRFVFAMISWLCFGLGFIWIALDKNRRSWHDIVSKSGLYSLPSEH